jgi:hypothetical protein
LLAFSIAVFFLSFSALGGREAQDSAVKRLRRDIQFLASDQCEGRGLNTKGINLAADYIAREFQKAGLKPAGAKDSYFQPFTVPGPGKLGSPNSVRLQGPGGETIDLKGNDEFRVVGLSGSGKVTAPVVFAGYGITAPDAGYDDYARLDVAGKVVVIVRRTPRWDERKKPFGGDMKEHYAGLVTKMLNADLHKAAGILFVNDDGLARSSDALMPFGYTANAPSAAQAPAVHVRRTTVDAMLQSVLKHKLSDLLQASDKDLKPQSAELKGWKATLEVNVQRRTVQAKNVVGVVEGSGPLARETVVVGAHYDHLGRGESGSLATRRDRTQIHHGADDNGSGTTVLMELARRFGAMKGRQGRRVVFIAFSGEEKGLLGSRHYCANPLYPLAQTVTMLNLDMVGRLRPDDHTRKDRLVVYGTGTAKNFDALLEAANKKFDFYLAKSPSGYGPSDQTSFYEKKIPVFFFFTGNHRDYHKPSDTADKINVAGMARVADLVQELTTRVAALPERPQYVKVASAMHGVSRVKIPILGFMPGNYGEPDGGVLIAEVRAGGPAEKGGIKEGDRIVEVAGMPVRNVESYFTLMLTQKRGKPLEITVLRKGKKIKLKVTPR